MQSVVKVDYVTQCQFSTLKGWLHYRVLIRQHWQEGTLLPLSQAQIRQDKLATLMPLRCRLKDKSWRHFYQDSKRRWLTDLRSRFKKLEELHGYWVEIGHIASRAAPREMSCHCPVTPDPEKNTRAAVAYLVQRGCWATHNPLFKLKFVRCLQHEVFAVWFIWCHVICRCWSALLLSDSDVMLHYKEPFMEALSCKGLNHTQSHLISWWSLAEVELWFKIWSLQA